MLVEAMLTIAARLKTIVLKREKDYDFSRRHTAAAFRGPLEKPASCNLLKLLIILGS